MNKTSKIFTITSLFILSSCSVYAMDQNDDPKTRSVVKVTNEALVAPLKMEEESSKAKRVRNIQLNRTIHPASFVEEDNGTITIITDNNEWANYQAESNRFTVKENDLINIFYKVRVQPGGKISLGLLNTQRNNWYGEELILAEGTHEGVYTRKVPADEALASLVFRNFHLNTPGQSTFTIEDYDMQVEENKGRSVLMEEKETVEANPPLGINHLNGREPIQEESSQLKRIRNIQLNRTTHPASFVEEDNGTITITTDNNALANYQAESNIFDVKENDLINIFYKVRVQPGGKISLGLLNTQRNNWYGEELILEEGTYEGVYTRKVPAKETIASLVLRNYHLESNGGAGQTTFTINQLEIQKDESIKSTSIILESVPEQTMAGKIKVGLNPSIYVQEIAKDEQGRLKVITDRNANASYQLESERFVVETGQTIRVPYSFTVEDGGIMGLGLLNTHRNGWYNELVLGPGTHAGTFEAIVPASETQASLVLRNYHLDSNGGAGQTTFTINELDVQKDESIKARLKTEAKAAAEKKAAETAPAESYECNPRFQALKDAIKQKAIMKDNKNNEDPSFSMGDFMSVGELLDRRKELIKSQYYLQNLLNLALVKGFNSAAKDWEENEWGTGNWFIAPVEGDITIEDAWDVNGNRKGFKQLLQGKEIKEAEEDYKTLHEDFPADLDVIPPIYEVDETGSTKVYALIPSIQLDTDPTIFCLAQIQQKLNMETNNLTKLDELLGNKGVGPIPIEKVEKKEWDIMGMLPQTFTLMMVNELEDEWGNPKEANETYSENITSEKEIEALLDALISAPVEGRETVGNEWDIKHIKTCAIVAETSEIYSVFEEYRRKLFPHKEFFSFSYIHELALTYERDKLGNTTVHASIPASSEKHDSTINYLKNLQTRLNKGVKKLTIEGEAQLDVQKEEGASLNNNNNNNDILIQQEVYPESPLLAMDPPKGEEPHPAKVLSKYEKELKKREVLVTKISQELDNDIFSSILYTRDITYIFNVIDPYDKGSVENSAKVELGNTFFDWFTKQAEDSSWDDLPWDDLPWNEIKAKAALVRKNEPIASQEKLVKERLEERARFLYFFEELNSLGLNLDNDLSTEAEFDEVYKKTFSFEEPDSMQKGAENLKGLLRSFLHAMPKEFPGMTFQQAVTSFIEKEDVSMRRIAEIEPILFPKCDPAPSLSYKILNKDKQELRRRELTVTRVSHELDNDFFHFIMPIIDLPYDTDSKDTPEKVELDNILSEGIAEYFEKVQDNRSWDDLPWDDIKEKAILMRRNEPIDSQERLMDKRLDRRAILLDFFEELKNLGLNKDNDFLELTDSEFDELYRKNFLPDEPETRQAWAEDVKGMIVFFIIGMSTKFPDLTFQQAVASFIEKEDVCLKKMAGIEGNFFPKKKFDFMMKENLPEGWEVYPGCRTPTVTQIKPGIITVTGEEGNIGLVYPLNWSYLADKTVELTAQIQNNTPGSSLFIMFSGNTNSTPTYCKDVGTFESLTVTHVIKGDESIYIGANNRDSNFTLKKLKIKILGYL